MEDHHKDLTKTFETLWKQHLKLNASKCAFRVSSGKILGYLVTHRGIEVNPDQIVALQLIGMTTALNRFISRSTDRCRPFFQLLKKWKGFQWTDECQQAFDELKLYLSQAPVLSRSVLGETLYMYLVVTDHAVSAILLKLDQGI